ncbi:MAG: 2-C-methyl-D-erythritol 4-phosphate cytidylyltransferase [Arenicella sp.]|jgi:2-C-methyl-D-erythritol 4-phosphate cytidylyltransferase
MIFSMSELSEPVLSEPMLSKPTLSKPRLWVVMPAAGAGSRMQAIVPKQYLSINGAAIIEHAIKVFLDNHEIQRIMIPLAENDQSFSQLNIAKNRRVATTAGGSSRAHSVLNGLNALSAEGSHLLVKDSESLVKDSESLVKDSPSLVKDSDWVLVHDAARPCLSSALLEHLIDSLRDDEVGGILAVPAKDTLKRASKTQTIMATVDRSDIWQAQTPQMFRYGILKAALTSAIEQNLNITDEASALEYMGYQPKLVVGDAKNLKVTTPEDLALAEFLLSGPVGERI